MPRLLKLAVSTLLLSCVAALAFAEDGESEKPKPKHTIKVVMKEAMKGGLNKKVISGKATTEEKLKLLDLYVSMLEGKPPVGDNASWQKMAGSATLAAAKVAVGREGAEKELKAATNCAACHKVHKPKKSD